jgi:hypothetical protein
MRQWTASFLATIAMLAAAASAEAAPIPITSVTPAQLLADYNVIVDGNLTTSNDIVGPVLVGGDLKATGPLNSSHVVLGTTAGTTAITGYGEVNVFDNVLAGTSSILGGSTTFIGGTKSGTLLTPGASSVLGGYTFPGAGPNNAGTFLTNIWTPLTAVSSNLAGLSANSSLTGNTLQGVAGANGAVFKVSLSTLNTLTGPLILGGCLALPIPCDALIDVTGTGTLTQNFQFPTASQGTGLKNVVVNFDDGATVNVRSFWTASILDPLGSVSATSDIVGNVVAMNFTTTAETHLPNFDCSDGLCVCPPGFPGCSSAPPVDTPEPGSVAVLGSALIAFAAIRRRRRS